MAKKTKTPEEETFYNMNLVLMNYDEIRKAMKGEPYKMKLNGSDYKVFAAAVNQGIDSRLQACFSADRGDKVATGSKADITISVESLPVLVRRLLESDDENSQMLGESILTSLGFRDNGSWCDPE